MWWQSLILLQQKFMNIASGSWLVNSSVESRQPFTFQRQTKMFQNAPGVSNCSLKFTELILISPAFEILFSIEQTILIEYELLIYWRIIFCFSFMSGVCLYYWNFISLFHFYQVITVCIKSGSKNKKLKLF